MAYNSQIPQPTDQLNNSQPQILANFQALAPFGNGYADFPVQGVAPTIASGDTGLYTFANATTGVNEQYIIKPSVDAPTNVPFTASAMSYNTMANSVLGWSYLPSGLLMKWGNAVESVNGLNLVDVSTLCAGPNFNYVFQVLITPYDISGSPSNFTAILASVPTAVSGNFQIFASNVKVTPNTGISFIVLGV